MPEPDLSDFDANRHRGGAPLRIDGILAELDETDPDRAVALRAALADPRYAHRVVARTVDSWGIPLGEGAVLNWRKRQARIDG